MLTIEKKKYEIVLSQCTISWKLFCMSSSVNDIKAILKSSSYCWLALRSKQIKFVYLCMWNWQHWPITAEFDYQWLPAVRYPNSCYDNTVLRVLEHLNVIAKQFSVGLAYNKVIAQIGFFSQWTLCNMGMKNFLNIW